MSTTQMATRGAKSGRRNEIGGFIAGKIDGAVLRQYVKEHPELGVDLDATDEAVAVSLALKFRETVAKTDQVRCDNCEGISSANEDRCPFCGDAGEVEESETESVFANADDVDEEVEDGEDEEVAAAPEEVEDGEDEEVAAAPVKVVAAKPEKKAKVVKEPKPKPEKKAKETNGTMVHVDATAQSADLVAAPELDQKIAEVKKWQRSVAENTFSGAVAYWNLGRSLLDINKNHLWKLRSSSDGKAVYKSWDLFCRNELGMSPTHAWDAIEVAKEYDNPAEVQAIGQTKAAMILKAAPVDRPALKEAAKAGASVSEIAKRTKESRKKHGSPKTSPQAVSGKKGAAAKKAKAAASRPEKVSIVSFEGTKTIKFFKRPATMKNLDLMQCKRAKDFGDQPFAIYDMGNGIQQQYFLFRKNGEIAMKIETRRVEE